MSRFIASLLALFFFLNGPAMKGNVEIWQSPLAAEEGGTVPIFRAVGQSETSSILNAGTYGSAPSMGGKYFALTQQGAQDFASASFNAGRQMSITSTTVPRSVFNQGFLFNDVGKESIVVI
jgi:hypothetical protein